MQAALLLIAFLTISCGQGNHMPTIQTIGDVPTVQKPTIGTKGVVGNTQVSRGLYLTRAANCLDCHTSQQPNSKIGAGGLQLKIPFGTIVTPNITPDVETGIGNWSPDEFYRAVHDGITKNGEFLYPAFPYPSFTKMSRVDVDAIYSYLKTLQPVHNKVDVNQLNFPFNIRTSLWVWRKMFFEPGEYVPDTSQSKQMNRGKYLATGVGHCGACHTPRNFMGATEKGKEFMGSDVDNWFASNLRYSARNGISQWSEDDLVHFLGEGAARGKATVVGPMADVVFRSTQFLTMEDLKALAKYLKTISSAGYYDKNESKSEINLEHGQVLYMNHCARCHQTNGLGIPGEFPPFFQNPVINQDNATNLINVILLGIPAQGNYQKMPSFARKLSEEDIASIANFIRVRWGSAEQPTVTSHQVSKKLEVFTTSESDSNIFRQQ